MPADVAPLPRQAPQMGTLGTRSEGAACERENRPEPVLCGHCGRTADNGIRCQGFCVADSGY